MNAFQLFGIDPVPFLDAEVLKATFLERSVRLHPDVGGAETAPAFAELNEAYKILLSDRLRLRHILELHGLKDLGSIGAVPGHLVDLFMQAGSLLNTSDRLIKNRLRAESFLEQAALQGDLLEKMDGLQLLLSELHSIRKTLSERLIVMGTVRADNPQSLENLKELYLELSYVEKWMEQVQEKIFLISEYVV